MTRAEVEQAVRAGFAGTSYILQGINTADGNFWDVDFHCPICGRDDLFVVFKNDQGTAADEQVRMRMLEHERKHPAD
jgi:hypothetical protein